jgi:hypothetical protein
MNHLKNPNSITNHNTTKAKLTKRDEKLAKKQRIRIYYCQIMKQFHAVIYGAIDLRLEGSNLKYNWTAKISYKPAVTVAHLIPKTYRIDSI